MSGRMEAFHTLINSLSLLTNSTVAQLLHSHYTIITSAVRKHNMAIEGRYSQVSVILTSTPTSEAINRAQTESNHDATLIQVSSNTSHGRSRTTLRKLAKIDKHLNITDKT